jgi:LPXTG-site transpeptidase (sortase) family protein
MWSKIRLKRLSIILGAAVAVCFLVIVLFSTTVFFRGFYTRLTTGTNSQVPRTGLPVRLVIPEIAVDAAVEDVGLTPQGAMAAPEGPTDVGWFDLGPRPGESGSAVIAGHEGWKDNTAAAFDDLYKLQKDDKIYIEDGQGAMTTFVVREIRTYDQNGDASDVFSSGDGKAHLNLITCEGTWNAAQKSYSNRLVVFADIE